MTSLHVLGQLVHYPAVAVEPLPAAEGSACVASPAGQASWARAQQRVGRSLALRVGILGCSSTAGCGALEPSMRCAAKLSWGRFAHDALAAGLHGAGSPLQTRIFHKNAVDASFFWDCTAQFLSPHSDIVVLEVMQNSYGKSFPDLVNGTMKAVHQVAPHAAVVFLRWSKPEGTGEASTELLGAAVTAAGASLVDMARATWIGDVHRFYARAGGKLDHHPNPRGHQIGRAHV